jgi:four helix bundle protein
MMQFDHERLDVYQHSLEFVAFVAELVKPMTGSACRNARDQLLRAAHSIPLNIAEGNGKRSLLDRKRFFEIARGSAMESAAALDVLVASRCCEHAAVGEGKTTLWRVVAMLTKMTERTDKARDGEEVYEH